MKSYNHLIEKLLDKDTLILAMKKAGKGKRKNNRRHKKLREYRDNPEQYVDFFIDYISNYELLEHHIKIINDGISAKVRKIVIPTAEEVVLHNAIIIVLKLILSRGMYEHSYACIENRGIHQAKKVIDKWIRKDKKNTKYYLKMDIKQFFNSVSQILLLKMFNKVLRDKSFIALLSIILKTVPYGIALGYTTSHWFANWLLTPLDHYIKETLQIKYYVRFVDDMVLFGSNKRKLHRARYLITKYLKENLDLDIKNNWQVVLFSDIKETTIRTSKTQEGRFLDFLGFKFYKNKTGLRKRLALTIRRKANHIYKKGYANIRDARQMVTYAGFCLYANCYKWFNKYILKKVSISKLRKQISKYDKEKISSKAKSSNLTLNSNPNLIICL